VLVIREKYQSYRSPTSTQPIKVKKASPETKKQTKTQNDQKIVSLGAGKHSGKSVSIQWFWPIRGQVLSYFSTGDQSNKGIDIAGNAGADVKAAADGEVVYTGDSLRGYGNLVIIKHEYDFLSAYGHNRKIFVKEGEYVKAGKKIAEVGSSGADVNKVHFEIRQAGTPVNPLHYLPE
jgi:lipoprotein NlpD